MIPGRAVGGVFHLQFAYFAVAISDLSGNRAESATIGGDLDPLVQCDFRSASRGTRHARNNQGELLRTPGKQSVHDDGDFEGARLRRFAHDNLFDIVDVIVAWLRRAIRIFRIQDVGPRYDFPGTRDSKIEIVHQSFAAIIQLLGRFSSRIGPADRGPQRCQAIRGKGEPFRFTL